MSSPAAGGTPGRPLVAAASCARLPDLHDDWPLLRAALADAGVDAVTAVWNDPAVDWSAFDLVLANGAWDNIHHVAEFLAWADGVAAAGVPVHNSPATLRWNIDKHYLRDLEGAGVPTVPTVWVEPGRIRRPLLAGHPGRRGGGQAVGVRWWLPHRALPSATSTTRPGRTCATSSPRGAPP